MTACQEPPYAKIPMQGIDCVHGAKMQICVGEGPPNFHVRPKPPSAVLLTAQPACTTLRQHQNTFWSTRALKYCPFFTVHDRGSIWAVEVSTSAYRPPPPGVSNFRNLGWEIITSSVLLLLIVPPVKKTTSVQRRARACKQAQKLNCQALNFLQWRFYGGQGLLSGNAKSEPKETRHLGKMDGFYSSTVPRSTACAHPPLGRSTPLTLSSSPCLQYAVPSPHRIQLSGTDRGFSIICRIREEPSFA